MTIRFGVAGTGYWARHVHIPALLAAPGVELVGVWGRNQSTVRSIAADNGIATFATFEDMLRAVDAVNIAVPPAVQPLLAIAAADAGKHMLLEKPLALLPDHADAVANAVTRSNVAALIFFMRRFVPEIEDAMLVASRESWDGADVQVHSAAMSSATPYAESRWRQSPGAALWDIGPHVLSILLPALGAVRRIHARHHADRRTTLEMEHVRGAQSTVSMTLHGDPAQVVRRYQFDAANRSVTLPEPPFSHQEALLRAIADLLEMTVAPIRTHRADVAFGQEVVRLLDVAQTSAATGKPLNLDA